MRFLCLVILAALVAGCGGSSGQGSTDGGGQTLTVPADAHGFYAEQEAILDQFPYQGWYVHCVVREAEKLLSPKEAEGLEGEPGSAGEERSNRAISEASRRCEMSGRPTVDPNASEEELDLLRASNLGAAVELAEANHLSSIQVACVESLSKKLSDAEIIELRNGTAEAREGILVSVFKPCSRLK